MKNIIETMRRQGFSDEAIKHVISRGNVILVWEPGRSMGRAISCIRDYQSFIAGNVAAVAVFFNCSNSELGVCIKK